MLDHAKLLQQLQSLSSILFVPPTYDLEQIKLLWERVVSDPLAQVKVAHAPHSLCLPSWSHDLCVHPEITTPVTSYSALAVDGSQIYPDRHQGTRCYLLNMGSVVIRYGQQQQVQFQSQPYVFAPADSDNLRLTADLVDCRRQEYELAAGITLYQQQQPSDKVLLGDGSLIFWHLANQTPELKEYFLQTYLALLEQLYAMNAQVAWYISAPKNKDLVYLMRYLLDDEQFAERAHVQQLYDTALVATFLSPYERTIPFASGSSLCSEYPAHLAPHFLYLHGGYEIARIEIPAWVAADAQRVDMIASCVLDQIIKGYGYPVVLAEAHEQAVVKGADRDFFYHLVAKVSSDLQQPSLSLSPKNIKKRGMGI